MVLAHDTTKGKRTLDVKITHDITFDTMLLSSKTLEGLNRCGFHKPSPIQLHGIPLGKCGFDLLLEAKSGTGKTAVFVVISLEKLDLNKALQGVILAPTREIAAQICDVIKGIGSVYTGLNVAVVMGGLPFQEDVAKFKSKNVHIVVGSPGRLRYLIQDGFIDTSSVRLLVLDEADKLMEKSFQADINYIFSALPKQKQVIMSSATYPEDSRTFLSQYVKNSQHICPNTTNILLGIEQKVTFVKYNSNIVIQTQLRYEELLKILTKKQFKQCLIFCNYQVRVTELNKLLTRDKWPSEQLYGSQEQTDRLDALKTLQDYKCRILISTDLAARGIDASNVDLVINFEPPYDWQTYLHRIGRAGRYGSYGIAITILSKGMEETKFNKNLSSMRNALNLTELWTDEKYDVKVFEDTGNTTQTTAETEEIKITSVNGANPASCKKAQDKVVSKAILQDVWNEIAASSENNKVLENFEDLNKSFEQSLAVAIESFSDLLQSFENDPCDNCNNCYVNIKVGKLSGKDCMIYLENNSENTNLSSMCTEPEYITKIKNYSAKIQDIKETVGDSHNIENKDSSINIVDEIQYFNGNEDNHFNKIDAEKETKEVKQTGLPIAIVSKQDQMTSKRENKIEDIGSNNVYNTSTTKAKHISHSNETEEMARLGLPTAFATRRYQNKKENKINETEEMARLDLPNAFATRQYQKKNERESKIEDEENYDVDKTENYSKAKTVSNNLNSYCKNNKYSDPFQLKQSCYHRYSHTQHDCESKNDCSQYHVTNNAQTEHLGYIQDMEDSREPYQYNMRIKNKAKHFVHKKSDNRRCRNLSSEKTDESVSSSSSGSEDDHAKYINWFKQLKMRTKQIEMALYLQELSQMNGM